jgi:hypothetical protein
MPETLAEIIPIVRFLATAGAGILASLIFAALRARFALPAVPPASPVARLGVALLYAPRYSRVSVLVLAGFLGIAFSALLALLEARPVLPAVDVLVAALISQLWHAARDLSGELPTASVGGVYAGLEQRLNQRDR